MRVALVHDDLVQWGGAERVFEGICQIFPDAPIFTSVYDKENREINKRFGSKKIITSFLQKIPGWKTLYKSLLPLYPLAFEQFNFDDFDLVISHTTRFAKSIITKPSATHICYCHTPPRFLWHFSGNRNYGLLEFLMSKLRIYDQVSARRVDHFIAGSQNAKKRIKKIYRLNSKVVYPFVDLSRFNNTETFDGGYFVVIGRSNKYKQSLKFSLRSNYKRFDLAIKACEKFGIELKVIDGSLSDANVVNILAGCKALIIPGIEDFGISSLEAQALGKPVIAYKKGGALETVIDGKTGVFFDSQTVDSLTNAIENLPIFDSSRCKENAKKFSRENFDKSFKHTLADLRYTI